MMLMIIIIIIIISLSACQQRVAYNSKALKIYKNKGKAILVTGCGGP
jgi:hypothetical protein